MGRPERVSFRAEAESSGATWTGSPKGVFAGRKHQNYAPHALIRACGELNRQAAGIFQKYPDMKLRTPTVLITIALICFGLLPKTQAVSPPPDGGYPGANTAEGQNALSSLTSGVDNTALGYYTLYSNTTGRFNTAVGMWSLKSNTVGEHNTAIGVTALSLNTTGNNNSAIGVNALYANTTGDENTAIGVNALYTNTTGGKNTANGVRALFLNTTGGENTAIGRQALCVNTTGSGNTAIGANALFLNGGSSNTADGSNALGEIRAGDDNTAIGAGALSRLGFFGLPTGNTALGSGAGANLTEGDNNIYLDNPGVDTESGTVRIGTPGTHTATFIAGISGTAVSGTAVVVDGNGQLGVATSSARFKDEIKPMDKTSEAILALKPVTFRYKREVNAERTTQFGLVAEDVEKVNPDLVVRDKEGQPYSVRYDAVNAMLLNEFLKEHRKNEEQQVTIAQLKSGIEALTATVKEQAAQIQKMSAQLEASTSAPQVADSNY
jgi:trimeric autotransporter adhesin